MASESLAWSMQRQFNNEDRAAAVAVLPSDDSGGNSDKENQSPSTPGRPQLAGRGLIDEIREGVQRLNRQMVDAGPVAGAPSTIQGTSNTLPAAAAAAPSSSHDLGEEQEQRLVPNAMGDSFSERFAAIVRENGDKIKDAFESNKPEYTTSAVLYQTPTFIAVNQRLEDGLLERHHLDRVKQIYEEMRRGKNRARSATIRFKVALLLKNKTDGTMRFFYTSNNTSIGTLRVRKSAELSQSLSALDLDSIYQHLAFSRPSTQFELVAVLALTTTIKFH